MRWQTLLILSLLALNASAQLYDYEGACENLICLMPHNPFYTVDQHCTITITLDYPLGGETFYTNTLTINTTTNGGIQPTYCWYTENGLGNITTNPFNCASKTITFPAGNVDLTVYALDNIGCTTSDTTSFNVVLFVSTGTAQIKAWPAYAMLGILVLFGVGNQRKKNRGTQTVY